MSDESPGTWLLGGGGLIALGSGLKWLWDKVAEARASRERKIEKREAAYVTKLEERLSKIEKQLDENSLAIALLVADIARREPGAAVLRQVQKILGASFPLQVGMPDSIHDPLETLKAF